MQMLFAALAALALAAAEPARADDQLSLEDAFGRVLAQHPDFQVWRESRAALEMESRSAALPPAVTVGLEVENVLGTGAASGIRGAEFTLSLASVIERGGKRAARIALAERHMDAAAIAREAARLDLLAEVARRYLDLLAAQALLQIVSLDVDLRAQSLAAATRRVTAGASPDSVRLSADAALAAAQMAREQALRAIGAASRRLAILWGDKAALDVVATGDLLALPQVPEFAALTLLLERSPELQEFATEQRLKEARLQLARSSGFADLQWSVGMRRMQAGEDWGVVAGVSMALGARRRAGLDEATAAASLAGVGAEREAAALRLHATLAEAQSRLAAAVSEASGLGAEVLPRWQQAQLTSQRAFAAGAISYLELAQAQLEVGAVRRARVAAAIDAHRALIELQRLTAAPFDSRGPALDQDSTP